MKADFLPPVSDTVHGASGPIEEVSPSIPRVVVNVVDASNEDGSEEAAASVGQGTPKDDASKGGRTIATFLDQLRQANTLIKHLESRPLFAGNRLLEKHGESESDSFGSDSRGKLKQEAKKGTFGHSFYDLRMDLLFPWQDWPTPETSQQGRLPAKDVFPGANSLHTRLLGGSVDEGHQKVAHILYPNAVPWPGEDTSATATSSARKHSDVELPQLKLPEAAEEQEDGGNDAALGATATVAARERSSVVSEGRATRSIGSSPRHVQRARSSVVSFDAEPQAVVVCGQRITQRVRGGEIVVKRKDRAAQSLEQEEMRHVSAKERRKDLQKALAVEQHREKKMYERIAALEQMKAAELTMQEELAKKEARRKARKEELNKMIIEGLAKRQQAEDEAMEKSKQEEAEAAAAEARRKKYHERQKEKLIERALAMNSSASGSDPQQADAGKTTSKTQVEKHKTQRQLEAEEKIRRLHLSLEERPPVCPSRPRQQHDIPIGALISPRESRVLEPRLPLTDTKAIGNAYGLTPREQSAVEAHVYATVQPCRDPS